MTFQTFAFYVSMFSLTNLIHVQSDIDNSLYKVILYNYYDNNDYADPDVSQEVLSQNARKMSNATLSAMYEIIASDNCTVYNTSFNEYSSVCNSSNSFVNGQILDIIWCVIYSRSIYWNSSESDWVEYNSENLEQCQELSVEEMYPQLDIAEYYALGVFNVIADINTSNFAFYLQSTINNSREFHWVLNEAMDYYALNYFSLQHVFINSLPMSTNDSDDTNKMFGHLDSVILNVFLLVFTVAFDALC